MVSDRVIAEHN